MNYVNIGSDCIVWTVPNHYLKQNITVTSQWELRHLKSLAFPLFAQLFVQAQNKENIKALHHWTLCVEFTGDRWIPRTKGQ